MILRKIEHYLQQSGMSATAFGRRVAHDPRLVHDLRRGRAPGQRLMRRIESFIESAK
jgi:hypothetical protein